MITAYDSQKFQEYKATWSLRSQGLFECQEQMSTLQRALVLLAAFQLQSGRSPTWATDVKEDIYIITISYK